MKKIQTMARGMIVTLMSLSLFYSIPSFAEAVPSASPSSGNETTASNADTRNTSTNTQQSKTDSMQSDIASNTAITKEGTVEFKKVPTMDQLTSKFEKKGNEAVKFLQRVSQPFSIIMLIVGAFMAVTGMATGSKMKGGGIALMVGAAIIYVSILFAPEILDFFVNWVKN